MFKVKSKFTGETKMVYSVNEKGDKFFMYDCGTESWKWEDSKNYEPVKEEKK